MDGVVFLLGNGLSRGFDEAFSTTALSAKVLGRLEGDDRRALELLAANSNADAKPGDPVPEGFEALAGPLDRIADALLVARGLRFGAGAPEVISRFQAASEDLRKFYLRIVGLVLQEVAGLCVGDAEPGRTAKWEKMNAFAQSLWDLTHRVPVRAFTLNYDSLLHASMLEVRKRASEKAGKQFYVFDGFRGGPLSHDFDLWEMDQIAVYHLHGSMAWVESNDEVVRLKLDDLRTSGLLDRWASGDFSRGSPCVILGDLKSKLARRHPFALLYSELHRRLQTAELVVVAGYSFGDRPVNDALRLYLGRYDRPKLVVLVRDNEPEKRKRIIESVRPPEKIDFRHVIFDAAQVVFVQGALPDVALVAALDANNLLPKAEPPA